MPKIWMYAHGGSGNHGCEAIVRSTCKMLNEDNTKDLVLISSASQEDKAYGLDAICDVRDDIVPYPRASLSFAMAYLELKVRKNYIPLDKLNYVMTIRDMAKSDVALSIGGDNYCYADVQKYIMLHDLMLQRKAKTVLWGCSVEPKLVLKPDIARDLARYHLITARETISYAALKKVNPNTVLVADPAFTLSAVETKLPTGFQKGNMVGVNLSPLVLNGASDKEVVFKNYEMLIAKVLKETDMGIALIPHVVWPNSDDRVPLKKLYEEFAESRRIFLIEDTTCEALKYVISQCRFFVGARTHATIAAYSSGVPTIVLGYSVKSRGISVDLFGTQNHYVVSVQNLQDPEELSNEFCWLMKNEDSIRKRLRDIMPEYVRRAYLAKKGLESLIGS